MRADDENMKGTRTHKTHLLSRYAHSFVLYCFLLFGAVVTPLTFTLSQATNAATVKAMISQYKKDPRGPYLDIRWFCRDGTTRAARDPCPDIPGNQHARYKEEVIKLGTREHIFLGQILTTTPYADFWDEDKGHSRLVQYQLERYLFAIDNGWINRRAQYYRGALQVEDENNWGIGFYYWLLEDSAAVQSKFFLLRQSAKDIPHKADNNTALLVRSLSRSIADTFPAFLDLRVKIHGTPDEGDIQRVTDFKQKNKQTIPADLVPKFDSLLQQMSIMYRPFKVSDLVGYLKKLPNESRAAEVLTLFIRQYPNLPTPAERCQLISHTGLELRRSMTAPLKSSARLALLDVSNKMEGLMKNEASQWKPITLSELVSMVHCLSEAATAFGFLELWEWDRISERMTLPAGDTISLRRMSELSEYTRYVLEWGTAMVRAIYTPVLDVFREFEPLAAGFFDDRIRGSILLDLGLAAGRLGDAVSLEAGFANEVMKIPGQSTIRGLNPGYTKGQLVVVPGSPEKTVLSPDKIYVFHHPPTNLKPVAGIMTVTEGNIVSHVQLLARNLGIPNAVLSQENMNALSSFNGTMVFYAVSPKGTVIIKPVTEMDAEETNLFKQKKEREEKISVPIERLILDQPVILNLRDVNASLSGKICGPKAANLGQLKQLFPENVVEGLVLPFAVFYQHMQQMVPGSVLSYWALMKSIFDNGENMRSKGITEQDIEVYMLHRLDSLRGLIKAMPLRPDFKISLEQEFQNVFGKPIGSVPVFVRSDTNMEDLKDFTGAGLNLTVFNVVDAEKIYQGIRDVWASPYAERSYKWRQRYLLNPENVFPSILIIPSVNADHSGVLITKGITTGRIEDITATFNRGVGGAVDGQAAESWFLQEDGTNHLVAPARENTFLAIPETGGSTRIRTTFEEPILTPDNFIALRELSARILHELPGSPGIQTAGPFDMELGFKDNHMWLFQVRPFAENKQAAASAYLQHITPVFDGQRSIPLDLKL